MTASAVNRFQNDPAVTVPESLAGLEAAHRNVLRYDRESKIVVRANAPRQGKVGVISGGGSGHEPLHGGFVGVGMLDAAVPGAIFTSPTPDQILAATKAADGTAGVFHIIKNYSGDVMNFRLAREDALDAGIDVAEVVVNDDVAVEDSTHTAGRRGVAGTVCVEKIAGAAAERGDDLPAVAGLAERVVARTRSFGVGISSCTPPGADSPLIELAPGEMEVGIGIHGEPGRRREALAGADEIAAEMVTAVLDDLQPDAGTKALIITNGMGGTPLGELYLIHAVADRLLREAGVEPTRVLVGNYVTSLDMAGASLTVTALDDELTELWDAPVHTAALRWGV